MTKIFQFLLALVAMNFWIPSRSGAAPIDVENTPYIRSIRLEGTNVRVTVVAPGDLRRITLETRPRLGTGNWVAKEFAWPDGAAGEYTFTLPLTREAEMIRVKGEDTQLLPLPAAFYKGRSLFDTIVVANDPKRTAIGGGMVPGAANDGLINNNLNAPPTPTVSEGAGGSAVREVVESDIWQLDATTLYFFNQNRGLQVIDVSNPDVPVIRGQLPVAAFGEQMYLLPHGDGVSVRFVALLTRNGCNWNDGSILIVRVENGVPTMQTRLALKAQVQESRLVGNALYAATQGWRERRVPGGLDEKGNWFAESSVWENVTTVESFDLTNPAQPIQRQTIELSAQPNAISATDRFLFVAVSGSQSPKAGENIPTWSLAGAQSVILFDISDPNGNVQQLSHLTTAGLVADKFKMHVRGDVLSVVSQKQAHWEFVTNSKDQGIDWQRSILHPSVTQLETFSLAQPTAPVRLGHLPIITNETVYATRYDGDRAYVVTFRQIDPLWIIDLSDPSNPTIQGELKVPGWSTYIHPMGDRLIAMGQENWGQPSVSLYDVEDAHSPKLLHRVALGKWAWSEANQDEKAFKVFAEAGMVLLPWSGQRDSTKTEPSGTFFQGMQLLDFTRDTLQLRGVIEHHFQARRATLLQNRILSISGTELITADYTDRDHPTIKATLDLAPQIDHAFPLGNHLISVTEASGSRPPQIHRSLKAKPDTFLSTLSLSNHPLVGVELRGDRLYVIQKEADQYRQEPQVETNTVVESFPQKPLVQYVTNDVVELVSVPPLLSYVTNEVVRLEPQPCKVVGSNLVEVTAPLPPLPDDLTLRFTTNSVWRLVYEDQPPMLVTDEVVTRVETPQPPRPETNQLISRIEIPQPPLLKTTIVVVTNIITIRTVGDGWLTVVDITKQEGPQRLGETRFEFAEIYYGARLQAVWPTDGLVVWTSESSGGRFYGGWPGIRLNGSIGGPIMIDALDAPLESRAICFGCDWMPWWGSTAAPELLGFDVTNSNQPVLSSRVTPVLPPDTGTFWNGTSATFAAAKKVYFSHSFSKYIPPEQEFITVTNADKSTYQLWQYGHYEQSHWLDVVDYSNPLAPILHAPASFPGTLEGISHQGALVYSRTIRKDDIALDALAYDGTGVFLVDSLILPQTWPQPLRVTEQGQVFLGRASTTNTEPSVLETWAVDTAAHFSRYGSIPLATSASELNRFDGLLVVTTTDNVLRLLDARNPAVLVPARTVELDCSYWFQLGNARGSLSEGLWIPRGIQGVWHIPTVLP